MEQQLRAALRPREAAAYLGIGQSTIWRRAKVEPDFPQPRKIGERCTVWMRADLDAFLARFAEGAK
jgi:predicted DNA-binding transcriptional regulator AlpA